METIKYVADIQDYEHKYFFISDSQDVTEIKNNYLPAEIRGEFDSFFVKEENGEYVEIWGMEGIVPYLYKKVYLIKGEVK